jgi:hypothetical protein
VNGTLFVKTSTAIPDGSNGAPHHELYLMCANLDETTAELAGKGVAVGPIMAQSWGRATTIQLPGGESLGLYEPRHPLAIPVDERISTSDEPGR